MTLRLCSNGQAVDDSTATDEHLRVYWNAMLLAQAFERDLQSLEVLIESLRKDGLSGSMQDAEESFRKRRTKTISKSRERIAIQIGPEGEVRWKNAQDERNWLAHECLLEYSEGKHRLEVVRRITQAQNALEIAHHEVIEIAAHLLDLFIRPGSSAASGCGSDA